MTTALVLVDVWDKTNDICKGPSSWWDEAEEIALNNIVPVLANARTHNWVIIHCHSGLPCMSQIAPIVGEYEILYNGFIVHNVPLDILEKISTMYFVGFALNLCMMGNNCGILRSRGTFRHKNLILLRDCTKALATDEFDEDESFEEALRRLRSVCDISLSEDIAWKN